jgi:ceroid-lipofuscinosis MFS transporter 7
LRAYASTASTVRDRPRAIALVTCGQAIGNTAGPGISSQLNWRFEILAFQLLFTPLGYPGFQLIPGMSIDMYTAPAYFACVMNFFGLLALFFLFNESYVGIIKKNPANTVTCCQQDDFMSQFFRASR